MQRLNSNIWSNIFRNLDEEGEQVEVIWLDEVGGPGEWVLAFDCELFEDGFTTEKEASIRLNEVAKRYYGYGIYHL